MSFMNKCPNDQTGAQVPGTEDVEAKSVTSIAADDNCHDKAQAAAPQKNTKKRDTRPQRETQGQKSPKTVLHLYVLPVSGKIR